MINKEDYKKLLVILEPLFITLGKKLDKDILISTTYKGKQRLDFIFNLLLEESKPRLTIFIGKEGLESFADLNINGGKDSLISPFEISYLDIELKDSENLTEGEANFFLDLDTKANNSLKLIINYFERGRLNPKLKPSVLTAIDEIVEVLNTIFNDQEEEKKLKENNMFLLYLNQKELLYSFFKTDESMFLPKISYRSPKVNEEIVLELKNLEHNDKSMHLSLAFTSNFTRKSYPLSIFCYGEIEKAFSDVILLDVIKEDRKKIIWSYLMDKLEKYGLPKQLYINDMEIFFYLEKTLKALEIEPIYYRQNPFINSYIDDLQLALFSYNENADIENRLDLEQFDDFLKRTNSFLEMVRNDGYDPVTQKLVDNLKDLYDLIINYSDETNNVLDAEDYDNNLVS